MNPKQFLQIGGIILVLLGILGFVKVIGPTAGQSLFGEWWWFDNTENWAHLILGIVALLLAYIAGLSVQRPVVIILGVAGVLVGLYSLLGYYNLLGANLENPADSTLHLAVGVWALLASWKKPAVNTNMGNAGGSMSGGGM